MKKNKVNAEKVLRQFRENKYNMSEPKQSLPKAQLGLFGKKKDAHCEQKYSGPTKYSKGCESVQDDLESFNWKSSKIGKAWKNAGEGIKAAAVGIPIAAILAANTINKMRRR